MEDPSRLHRPLQIRHRCQVTQQLAPVQFGQIKRRYITYRVMGWRGGDGVMEVVAREEM